MPRYKTTRATYQRLSESRNRVFVRGRFKWADPFPEIHGTLPEKMVYAAFSHYNIPFYFLNDLTFSDPEADFFKTYQADFFIPAAKMIIEVQGAHWHSMPKTIESDNYKLAVYEVFGYQARAWWDYDIFDHLSDLILSEPLLVALMKPDAANFRSSELTPVVRTKVDTSKGIRTLNAKKKRPYRVKNQTSRRQLRKVQSSYAPK